MLLAGAEPASASARASISCDVGPVSRTYGGADWLVYSCNDAGSLVFVSAPGNPAMPFVFIYAFGEDGYKLTGEGNGDKRFTQAAFEALAGLTDADRAELLRETRAKGRAGVGG